MIIDAHIRITEQTLNLFNDCSGYRTLMDDYLKRLCRCSFVDRLFLWACPSGLPDFISVPDQIQILSNPIVACPGFDYPGPLELFQDIALRGLRGGPPGDVMLFADPQFFLIRKDSYEAMYDQLMENEEAHVIYPVYKVDPHLYLKMTDESAFLPVWEYPGLDRQKYPQLYRKSGIYMFHSKRTRYKQPLKEIPFVIPWHEGRRYNTAEDIDFADYMINHKGFI